MLITNLIFELKNHKLKLVSAFIFLVISAVTLLNIGSSSYIKQTLYINIKPLVFIDQNIDFSSLNKPLTTRSFFTIRYDENSFYSPRWHNKNLDLNTPSLYESFIEKRNLERIKKTWRPGFNVLANYNTEKRRFEITLQLFDNQEVFDMTVSQINHGINDYFSKPSNKSDLVNHYKNTTIKFNKIVELLDIQTQYVINTINNFEKIGNDFIYQSNPVVLYTKLEITDKILQNKIRLSVLNDATYELNGLRSLFTEYNDISSFYSLGKSEKKIIRRGLFPEYVAILFLILFFGFAFFISYFSLIMKKR